MNSTAGSDQAWSPEQPLPLPQPFSANAFPLTPGLRHLGVSAGNGKTYALAQLELRYVAEAVFWTPAAVLPGPGVDWKWVDNDCARLTVNHQGLSQSVDVTVAPDGQPIQVCFERWSNANPDKQHRLQPFGGHLSTFRVFAGFRLPTHVEAGNGFGTDQYFPFFVVDVTDVDFPHG